MQFWRNIILSSVLFIGWIDVGQSLKTALVEKMQLEYALKEFPELERKIDQVLQVHKEGIEYLYKP